MIILPSESKMLPGDSYVKREYLLVLRLQKIFRGFIYIPEMYQSPESASLNFHGRNQSVEPPGRKVSD